MVAPGSGDLDGTPAQRLAPHVSQIGRGWREDRPCDGRGCRPVPGAAQDVHQLTQRGSAPHGSAADQCGLTDVTERDDHAEWAGGISESDHAGDVAQRAVEPELPAEGEAVGGRRAELARSHEQAHRDGKVEAGASLPYSRGGEVRGDPPHGPWQTTRQNGGPHPIARLTHRRIGQADDGETGQTVRDMDLDRNGTSDGTVQRGGSDRGEHAGERSHRLLPAPDPSSPGMTDDVGVPHQASYDRGSPVLLVDLVGAIRRNVR